MLSLSEKLRLYWRLLLFAERDFPPYSCGLPLVSRHLPQKSSPPQSRIALQIFLSPWLLHHFWKGQLILPLSLSPVMLLLPLQLLLLLPASAFQAPSRPDPSQIAALQPVLPSPHVLPEVPDFLSQWPTRPVLGTVHHFELYANDRLARHSRVILQPFLLRNLCMPQADKAS